MNGISTTIMILDCGKKDNAPCWMLEIISSLHHPLLNSYDIFSQWKVKACTIAYHERYLCQTFEIYQKFGFLDRKKFSCKSWARVIDGTHQRRFFIFKIVNSFHSTEGWSYWHGFVIQCYSLYSLYSLYNRRDNGLGFCHAWYSVMICSIFFWLGSGYLFKGVLQTGHLD